MAKRISIIVACLVLLNLYMYAASGEAYAQDSTNGIGQIESFVSNLITVIARLAGIVATGFFMSGGFMYMTSSGSPEKLERSKRTIIYAAIGLAITFGAFAISGIVSEIANNSFGA